jgi:hypothetical protein
LLYPWWKNLSYPLDRRLGGSQIQYGCCWHWKNLLSLQNIKPWFLDHFIHGQPPYWLNYLDSLLDSHIKTKHKMKYIPPKFCTFCNILKKVKAIPITSTFSRQSAHRVRLSFLCTGHSLLPRNITFLLLVLISVKGWINPRAQCSQND